MINYAEESSYWDTTVHHAKSMGEISELLEKFGASGILISQGQAGGTFAWIIRFQWQGGIYRFVFIPLECRWPNKVSSFGGSRRMHLDQARYQMGRIAVHFVKAILTAAGAQSAALFGFLELPDATPAGVTPPTAAELGASYIVSGIRLTPDLPSLSDRNEA